MNKIKFHFRNWFNRLHAIVAGSIFIALTKSMFVDGWEQGDLIFYISGYLLIIIPTYFLIKETNTEYKQQ